MRGLRASGGPTFYERDKISAISKGAHNPAPFLHPRGYSLQDPEQSGMAVSCHWQEAFSIPSDGKLGYEYVVMEGGQYEQGSRRRISADQGRKSRVSSGLSAAD